MWCHSWLASITFLRPRSRDFNFSGSVVLLIRGASVLIYLLHAVMYFSDAGLFSSTLMLYVLRSFNVQSILVFVQNLMAEQMRTNDVAMRNIETFPGGYDHLRRAFTAMDGAVSDAQQEAGTVGAAGGDPLAQMLQSLGMAPGGGTAVPDAGGDAAPQASSGPNAAPLPNPWAAPGTPASGGTGIGAPGAGGLGALAGLFGGGGNGGVGSSDQAPYMNTVMGMMNNPQMQEMARSMMNNPEMMQSMQTMLRADPNVRRVLDSNPAARDMMADPERLRQMLSPEVLLHMLRLIICSFHLSVENF
jgi:ubiquilin